MASRLLKKQHNAVPVSGARGRAIHDALAKASGGPDGRPLLVYDGPGFLKRLRDHDAAPAVIESVSAIVDGTDGSPLVIFDGDPTYSELTAMGTFAQHTSPAVAETIAQELTEDGTYVVPATDSAALRTAFREWRGTSGGRPIVQDLPSLGRQVVRDLTNGATGSRREHLQRIDRAVRTARRAGASRLAVFNDNPARTQLREWAREHYEQRLFAAGGFVVSPSAARQLLSLTRELGIGRTQNGVTVVDAYEAAAAISASGAKERYQELGMAAAGAEMTASGPPRLVLSTRPLDLGELKTAAKLLE